MVWIGIACTGVICGFLYFFLRLKDQNQNKEQLQFLETLRVTISTQHQELERNQELKNTLLRTELSEALKSGRQEMQQALLQTSQLLEQKVSLLDNRLDGRMNQLTEKVGTKLDENLKEGFRHFEQVQEHLKKAQIELTHLNQVGQSVRDLNNLLKLPHLRGSFGEAMLEQLLNDFLPQDCYELQYRILPHSTERVDAVIKYPNAVLPIDSKFPREQVLPLFESNDPLELEVARKNLGEILKGLAKQIREKYVHPEHGTTDMALLFIPSETLYFELLRNVKVQDDLAKQKVFAVSPNTLAVCLQSISLSRHYYDMANGVEKTILEMRKAQTHFRNFESRFEEVGTALGKAQNSFQTAQTHLSRFESAVVRLTGTETPEVSAHTSSIPSLPVVDA